MQQPPTWRHDPFLWLAMVLVGGMLTALSLARYWGYNAGMLDLGAMAQAIFSTTRGHPLVTTGYTGNFSRLAGHVELIYYAFAPILAVWRDPQALLIGQAALAAAGAIPAYRLARRRLDSVLAARCVALIYLFYPVAQTAVLFDFHGDTLAMPLLLFALDAADRRAWRAYAGWVGLALLCKLYIVAPVAGIGAYLFLWGGERRVGLLTGIIAVAWGGFLFFYLREVFAPPMPASAAVIYVSVYFGNFAEIPATLPDRLLSGLAVFGPALFLAWRGWRWLLVGAGPLATAALISTGPGGGYHYAYHHFAAVVPFVIMATIDAAARLKAAAAPSESAGVVSATRPTTGARPRRNWRNDLVFTTVVVVFCCASLVMQPLGFLFWLPGPLGGLDASTYGVTARDTLKTRFLAEHRLPPETPVAASVFLASHIADRDLLYLVRYPDDPGGERLPTLLPQVDYVLADSLFDWRQIGAEQILGGLAYERREIGQTLRDPAFGLVAARDGLLLFQRDAPPAARMRQEVNTTPAPELPVQTAYFGPIRLLGAEVAHLGGRRYSAHFAWTATGPLPRDRGLVAVSSLVGVPGTRMVHLPTFALRPTETWAEQVPVSEYFEVELPPDLPPGRYNWQVAWHDPAHPEAHATDDRSLLPTSAPVVVATIEVP